MCTCSSGHLAPSCGAAAGEFSHFVSTIHPGLYEKHILTSFFLIFGHFGAFIHRHILEKEELDMK